MRSLLTRLLLFTTTLALLAFATPARAADDIAAQMKTVERLRGLAFLHAVKTESIDRSELPARLRKQMEKSMPYSPDDYVTILRSLQLVDEDSGDLLEKMLALYEAQVLAFYDPLSHTYYSLNQLPPTVKGVGDPAMLAESVAVHELTHALQDQRFHAGEKDMALQQDNDGSLAYHALVEGEATLVMMDYLLDKQSTSLDDVLDNDLLVEAISQAAAADKSSSDSPRFFVESLKFPYVEGLRLCVAAYRRGKWKEIDRIHANPPATTREVLHVDEYFKRLDEGTNVVPFDEKAALGLTKNVLSVEHLGEFVWRYLLGEKIAAGWKDDRVTIAQNKFCETTVLAETRWDSEEKASAFAGAYVDFLGNRGIGARTRVDGTTVRVAYGADASLASQFVQ